MITGSFHISLFEGTLHVNKIYVWFKIANITHALPVSVHRQTDFTPKRVFVLRLHDTVASFRTGAKFSPRYNNWGELTPGRHNILWWYHVNKCRAMRGNRSELASGRKSPRCHVNTPYIQSGRYTRTKLLFLQSEKRLLIGRECATCHVSRKAVKFSAVFFLVFPWRQSLTGSVVF